MPSLCSSDFLLSYVYCCCTDVVYLWRGGGEAGRWGAVVRVKKKEKVAVAAGGARGPLPRPFFYFGRVLFHHRSCRRRLVCCWLSFDKSHIYGVCSGFICFFRSGLGSFFAFYFCPFSFRSFLDDVDIDMDMFLCLSRMASLSFPSPYSSFGLCSRVVRIPCSVFMTNLMSTLASQLGTGCDSPPEFCFP